MASSQAERNLLVGMIALQMELITQEQLLRAFQAWTLDREKTIESLLLDQRAITHEGQAFIAAIATKFISLHQESIEFSIASLSSIDSLREKLAALDDDEIEKTLVSVENIKRERSSQREQHEEPTLLHHASFEGRRFKILRPHAKGGLGEVSIAEDLELHREVALKQIQARFRSDPESRARFMIEAEITGRLEHPGIVPVYSLGTTEFGKPFYAMRFIHGDSLRQAISKLYASDQPKLDTEAYRMAIRKLLRRFVDVCNAMEYAHSRGVLHRDLKPGNIMLGKYGETLVVDWGLAKPIGKTDQYKERTDEPTVVPKSQDGSSHTQLGTIVGTLAYMSPEQASGQHQTLGIKADIYSLGATLYHLLTGHAPIPKGETAEMLRAILEGKILSPKLKNTLVPEALSAVCMKALALRPEDRYGSAAALADEIELWLADEPVKAYREPLYDRMGRLVRRHQTLVASSLLILVLSTLSLVGFNRLVADRNHRLQVANDAEREQRLKAEQAQAEAISRRDESLKFSLNVLLTAEKDLQNNDKAFRFRTKVMDMTYENFERFRNMIEPTPTFLEQYATVARLSANQKSRAKEFREASRRLEKAVESSLLLANTDESWDRYSGTLCDLAASQRVDGQFEKAKSSLIKAYAVSDRLLLKSPGHEGFLRTKIRVSLGQAMILIEQLELKAAADLIEFAATNYQQLASSKSGTPAERSLAALSFLYRAHHMIEDGKSEAALAYLTEKIPVVRGWVEETPRELAIQNNYLRLLSLACDLQVNAGTFTADDRQNLDKTRDQFEIIAAAGNDSYVLNIADALRVRSRMMESSVSHDEAMGFLEKAEKLSIENKSTEFVAEMSEIQAKIFHRISELYEAKQDDEKSMLYREKAKQAADRACSLWPESRRLERNLRRIRQ